jgi:hypothetical protein
MATSPNLKAKDLRVRLQGLSQIKYKLHHKTDEPLRHFNSYNQDFHL